MKQDREIQPDPTLGAALRWVEGEPPMDQVDWEALRGAVRRRAELPLARRRSRSARLRRWARPLLPLAVAASVALALWVGEWAGREPSTGAFAGRGAADVPAAPALNAEEAFRADVSEQEFQLMVSGHDNGDALLLIALDES